MRKKREYNSSELVKSFAKIYGFEDKLLAFKVKDFMEDYLDHELFSEIESVNYKNKTITLKIHSPLFRNDLKMRKSFFLEKFQKEFGEEQISDLLIL